jgi:hypothetical protein
VRAPHQLVEIAADQQEEEQHHRAVEIGVGGEWLRGLDDGHAEREHDAERDRHVHVDGAGPHARSALSKKGRPA